MSYTRESSKRLSMPAITSDWVKNLEENNRECWSGPNHIKVIIMQLTIWSGLFDKKVLIIILTKTVIVITERTSAVAHFSKSSKIDKIEQ